MCRKEGYKDLEKHRITCRKQRRRYYQRTTLYAPSKWTPEQEKLVLEHKVTDHELSAQIGHSVKAIQIRRSRLKKELQKKTTDLERIEQQKKHEDHLLN